MSWVVVGVAAAGAIKGMMDAKAADKQAGRNDKFRKVAIANSPWTGMGDPGAGNVGNTDMASGALGGGLQGAMIGSMFGGGGGDAGDTVKLGATDKVAMNTNATQAGGVTNPWQNMRRNTV